MSRSPNAQYRWPLTLSFAAVCCGSVGYTLRASDPRGLEHVPHGSPALAGGRAESESQGAPVGGVLGKCLTRGRVLGKCRVRNKNKQSAGGHGTAGFHWGPVARGCLAVLQMRDGATTLSWFRLSGGGRGGGHTATPTSLLPFWPGCIIYIYTAEETHVFVLIDFYCVFFRLFIFG